VRCPSADLPKRLLIVDDDDSFRRLVATLLSGEGYQLLEAETGQRAMRELLFRPPQLLITDIVMPDQDGLETIRKAHRLFPELKIIAISGVRLGEQYLDIALSLGAQAALRKHEVTEQLPQIVRRLSTP